MGNVLDGRRQRGDLSPTWFAGAAGRDLARRQRPVRPPGSLEDPHLVARANGRPFVWVDDEITEADRVWVAANHPAPSMLHRVNPATSLTSADFEAIARWLDSR
jgi:hypothetical protein